MLAGLALKFTQQFGCEERTAYGSKPKKRVVLGCVLPEVA